jgi:MFS family permease
MLICQVSDVVSLEDRGKYQGFISAACSLGTAVGPFVGGGLATAGQWRWLFWLDCNFLLRRFGFPLITDLGLSSLFRSLSSA